MIVRPATFLSFFLLASFALLLLSTLSTPIIESINIATYGGVKFGVFGYCSKQLGGCSGAQIGYDMDKVMANEKDSQFSLPSKARNSLTNLLIVHPIAALFTLIQFVLSILAHLHGPAHSPKYLLFLLIFSLPTLLVSLLAFLVDILIFLPHLQWGGWIVLAATILSTLGGIATCGIRRQVVGRIARSKRIQQNAEMSGENGAFAQRTGAVAPPAHPPDKLPEFATFEVNKPGARQPEGERIPLNPRARASLSLLDDQGFTRTKSMGTDGSDRTGYGPSPHRNGPLDQGSNPMGGNGMSMPTRQRSNQYNEQTMYANTINGSISPHRQPQPMPMRGPGYGSHLVRSYGAPPQTAFDSLQTPPPGRIGSSPSIVGYSGGPSMSGGLGHRQEPGPQGGLAPAAMVSSIPIREPLMGNYAAGAHMDYAGNGSYATSNYGPSQVPTTGVDIVTNRPPPRRPIIEQRPAYNEYLPVGVDNDALDERGEFEKIIGLAKSDGCGDTESRQSSGIQELPSTASNSRSGSGTGNANGRLAVVNEHIPNNKNKGDLPPSEHSRYTQHSQTESTPQNLVELPAAISAHSGPPSLAGSLTSKRASGSYYEDVAPKFDQQHIQRTQSPLHQLPVPIKLPHPPILMPGPRIPPVGGLWSPPPIPDDIEEGQRSPAMSTTSGFTSISQRGVNPRWQEEQNRMGTLGRGTPRASVGLAGNPDFELPVAPRGRGRGGRGGLGLLR